MTGSYDRLIMPMFNARHYQTDGKLENMIDSLNATGQPWLGLLVAPGLDSDDDLTLEEWVALTNRACEAAAYLKKRGIHCDMFLPGPGGMQRIGWHGDKLNRWIKACYSLAAKSKADTLWVNDCRIWPVKPGKQVINYFRLIYRSVYKFNRKMRMGLLAAHPQYYQVLGFSVYQVAQILAGDNLPLMAQKTAIGFDWSRLDLLHSADLLTRASAFYSSDNQCDRVGIINDSDPSSFNRSAEAVQIQMNLNLLYGYKGCLFDGFDHVGSAPGNSNLYLSMLAKNQRFTNQLSRLLGERSYHEGISIILDDKSDEEGCLASDFWRLGFPARYIAINQLNQSTMPDTVYILTGGVAAQLSRRQLESVFHHGVLLEAEAAKIIGDEMKRNDLLGVQVRNRIQGIQSEIVSNQGFATRYYGYETLLNTKPLTYEGIYKLSLIDDAASSITALIGKKNQAPQSGLVLFDNVKKHSRCAILPYAINYLGDYEFLTPARQLLLKDVLCWLHRRQLPCFVENAPDLAPFLVRCGKKRLILALLNISYDWAIQSRIQLGGLPFSVKRIRHLNEQGDLREYKDLQLHKKLDYQYLELNESTAVAPMQMTVLLLEG